MTTNVWVEQVSKSFFINIIVSKSFLRYDYVNFLTKQSALQKLKFIIATFLINLSKFRVKQNLVSEKLC